MRRHKDPSRRHPKPGRQPKRKTTQAQKTPATPTAATTATSTGALHLLRGGAPVTWRCTRYVAVHPNRRGALPTDRVQRPNKQEQTRNWHTEPLTATPLHAHLGPTGGGMGTPPTPPPALRPTPAHSDTSYTLKCEEPDSSLRRNVHSSVPSRTIPAFVSSPSLIRQTRETSRPSWSPAGRSPQTQSMTRSTQIASGKWRTRYPDSISLMTSCGRLRHKVPDGALASTFSTVSL